MGGRGSGRDSDYGNQLTPPRSCLAERHGPAAARPAPITKEAERRAGAVAATARFFKEKHLA